MNFLRFENWIKTNKFFSVILFILFISGIIFQSSDLLSKIKEWRSPAVYQILDLHEGVFSYVENLEDEFNFADPNVSRNLRLEHDTNQLGDKKIGKAFSTSHNDIWLVRFYVSDIVTNRSGDFIDYGENFSKYDDENIRPTALNQEMEFMSTYKHISPKTNSLRYIFQE